MQSSLILLELLRHNLIKQQAHNSYKEIFLK